MINKKIFLFYFVFVFTNIFCFGQADILKSFNKDRPNWN